MPIDITFLGTGGAFCDFRQNYHNNVVVQADGGLVLIDCGATAVQSLKELGIPVWEIKAVIVTHMHGDHIGGLEQLIWERCYTGANPRVGAPMRPTKIIAPHSVLVGVRQMLTPCIDEYTTRHGVVRCAGYNTLVREQLLEPYDSAFMGGTQFRVYETPHVTGERVAKPSFGVLITDHVSNARCIYTSDTTFRRNLLDEVCPDPELVFHDCSFAPRYHGTVHTHYEELLTLPDDVRARIILMHHTKVPDHVDPIRDGFQGVAHRHETFTLGGGDHPIAAEE